nr:lipid-A-disaccharide synthase-related protein [Cyanobium sp. LEGE 06143]
MLLSNGHGEDLSGALVGAALMARGVAVEALPLVGHGSAYRQRGIAVLGPTREFRTGGLGFTSFHGQLSELLGGQVAHVMASLLRLMRRRGRYQLVVAVGDLVAVLGAWLGGCRCAVYLVAYSSHYEGKLRLPWPCGWLLRRRRVSRIWSRDALTASDLSQQLRRPVDFLGNPFLDAAVEPALARTTAPRQLCMALLPGSRMPEAGANLELMLRLLALLPQALHQPDTLQLRAVLVKSLDAATVRQRAAAHGWRARAHDRLERGGLELKLSWSGAGAALARADLVLAMAGTATEQAVGLGKPVLQLVGQGPQFTEGFAEAQRRLLGAGVHCASGEPGTAMTLEATARLAWALLAELADPATGPELRSRLARTAQERIGAPGGTERLAAAIMELLPPVDVRSATQEPVQPRG